VNVSVDRTVCRGHAQCVMIAPEVFALDDSDRARVLTPAVLPEHEAAVDDASVMCPQAAITIEP
jgi:ferredoxin